MRHTVTVEEFDEWFRRDDWHIFASSATAKSIKTLQVSTVGMFRVTADNNLIYAGGDKREAIAAYNAAT